ncbi:Phosphate metabolism transcription protein [Elasticomyces elasticus]|uniref:Phosphate metabolism transcription protein n=1 Tax=Exophiala sideris TaxID=1016849 RepID=A0ABR0JQW7_9EURO|nr:Phosphate metabolism transcription protein [Elasticomyces elasticus]KAK5038227.1 Phosphate metabolism transcription protein [Exophiala sideris]KAK5044211.1 Phosphate metabolism transcription protein [Exophiala sideris]KAK5067711.1 Phosphate metabolism transcription protein [Exophiala sideris]KAK5184049.1 Phosphate metabolism transcription protein [Eurotiomycetes sp. CCFEE 6388]
MRFGKTLSDSVYPPWKDKYLEYDKIKKLLREDETSPQGRGGEANWTEQDEETFVHELTVTQLEKVNQHQVDTFSSIRDRAAACESELPDPEKEDTGKSEDEWKDVARDMLKELDGISKDLNELRKFSRVNYTGFLKAAKKHDRKRGLKYHVRPILQVRLAQTPFNSEDYAPLLYRLSAMYTWARQKLGEESANKETDTDIKPKDTYTAHKYWVHADNLLEVKTYLLRRLPVLVYNPQDVKVVDSSQKDPSLTSIYFDNHSFDLYQSKVEKTEAGLSVRLRWTGHLTDKPEIVLEKKFVGENEESNDIRIQIKEKYINSFLKGEYKMEKQIQKLEDRLGPDHDEVKNLKANVDEIQSFIKDKQLEPVLRASYTRTAFQIPGDDRIRVSLDTDLTFIREDALDPDRPCRDPDDWHRSDIDKNEMDYPYSAIKKGEISRFPHAILEIKVKDTKYTRNNAWLHDLMNSHLVKEEKRFSKFVHGVAELFEDYVNSFPFWLSDLETDIRRDPVTAYQEEQEREQKKAEDEMAVGSFLAGSKLSSPRHKVGSPGKYSERRLSGQISQSVQSRSRLRDSQLQSTAEEPDSDDDGVQGTEQVDVRDSSQGGIRSFLPAFSNSRYARRHRQRNAWDNAPLPPGVKEPSFWIKDQGDLKVEAKVWLANQRTFIKWQHVAILLATLSLSLYNAAGVNNNIARIISVVYTVFAIFAAVWGWGIYMWRSKLITERSGKDFDAVIGPFVVSIGLAVALVLNFAFKYRAAVADNREDNSTALFMGQGQMNNGLWVQEL